MIYTVTLRKMKGGGEEERGGCEDLNWNNILYTTINYNTPIIYWLINNYVLLYTCYVKAIGFM